MTKRIKRRNSANELYDNYTFPQKLIQYRNGIHITEGIYDIVHNENFSQIIDIICRHKKNFEVEIWKFSRQHENRFTLMASNTLNIPFLKLENIEVDFYFDDLILIKKNRLICLPIEENLY
ncbi:DUF6876 family protein [Chryseobacterium sp.]|jgi:hypothetical protein|uniref:DUF6876 family protein n=1 Tax=Chryseobacterium sp. TaxID=1871047 RepID=UPI003917F3B8